MKRVLFLAPQPFFQERGTPIAVKLALQALAESKDYKFDLLVYPEGEPIEIDGVTIHRSYLPAFIKAIGPGISWRKIVADLFFAIAALKLVIKARKSGEPYDLVHAVEEAVFIGYSLWLLFRIPYVYDMDSCLSLQLTDKWKALRVFRPMFQLLERIALQPAVSVIAVCEDLANIARLNKARSVQVIHDISLLSDDTENVVSLIEEFKLPKGAKIALYVGNLEAYQGIELLLESFKNIYSEAQGLYIVIIGGRPDHINYYRALADDFEIADRVIFAGPRSVSELGGYLRGADILLSPRVSGNNTPMKIYSYLHAGKPIVATELPTHTQVLNSEIAILAKPTPERFSEAMKYAFFDQNLSEEIGEKARRYALENFTYQSFSRSVISEYIRIGSVLDQR